MTVFWLQFLARKECAKTREYPDANFLVLCKKCHEKLHGRRL
nr:MAG TPA: HNH endonuclease [Caudoviricetes sp.]